MRIFFIYYHLWHGPSQCPPEAIEPSFWNKLECPSDVGASRLSSHGAHPRPGGETRLQSQQQSQPWSLRPINRPTWLCVLTPPGSLMVFGRSLKPSERPTSPWDLGSPRRACLGGPGTVLRARGVLTRAGPRESQERRLRGAASLPSALVPHGRT